MTYKPKHLDTDQPLNARDILAADHWVLVRTRAGDEFDTIRLLRSCGVMAWSPVAIKWRRVGRSQMKVRHMPSRFAAFAGYIFAGMAGPRDYSVMFETGRIRAVVAVGDRPFEIAPALMAKLVIGQRAGQFDDRKAKHVAPDFKVGEVVRVSDPAFAGLDFTIKTIKAGAIGVMIDMLGKRQYVEFAIDVVRKKTV